MIHAYNELYLNTVMHNLGELFDIAINSLSFDADEFAMKFANSIVSSGIECASPNMLAGKSATEMIMLILNEDVEYTTYQVDRTKEYWAGWILAKAQWYLNKSFKEILLLMPFSKLISLYYPFHEASEMKIIEMISEMFPKQSTLKTMRIERKLTQEQLSILSGINLRTIKSYEQGENDILKAQGETLLKLARTLDCSVEDLLK